jgi:hypothetical protein
MLVHPNNGPLSRKSQAGLLLVDADIGGQNISLTESLSRIKAILRLSPTSAAAECRCRSFWAPG